MNGSRKKKKLGKKYNFSNNVLQMCSFQKFPCVEICEIENECFAFHFEGNYLDVKDWKKMEEDFKQTLLRIPNLHDQPIEIIGTCSGSVWAFIQIIPVLINSFSKLAPLAFHLTEYIRNLLESRVNLSEVIGWLCDINYEGTIKYENRNNIYDDIFVNQGRTIIKRKGQSYQIGKSVIHSLYLLGLSSTTITLQKIDPPKSTSYNTFLTIAANLVFPISGFVGSASHIDENPTTWYRVDFETSSCSFKVMI